MKQPLQICSKPSSIIEELLDLRAGDEDGDLVGETQDNGPRDKLHGSALPCRAENDQENAGQLRAQVQLWAYELNGPAAPVFWVPGL